MFFSHDLCQNVNYRNPEKNRYLSVDINSYTLSKAEESLTRMEESYTT